MADVQLENGFTRVENETFNFESAEDVLLVCQRCHKLIHRIALEYRREGGTE